MIEAKFYIGTDGSVHAVVSGHAASAPKGQDLVCAGVSALVTALGAAVERMYWQEMMARCPRIELGEGYAEIIASPKDELYGAAVMAFWVIQNGVAELARTFPEYVKITETMRIAA